MRKYGVPTERFGEERSEECVDDEVEESVEEGIVEQAPSSAAITSRGRAFVRVVMAGVLASSCRNARRRAWLDHASSPRVVCRFVYIGFLPGRAAAVWWPTNKMLKCRPSVR